MKFQCRTQHCVCRDGYDQAFGDRCTVSMPHAALCVSRRGFSVHRACHWRFQCRTQHCVCRDIQLGECSLRRQRVSMPHAALCVSRREITMLNHLYREVSMPHAALCVSRPSIGSKDFLVGGVSMPHAALCVSRPYLCQVVGGGIARFNAARSIVCVETPVSRSPCPARAEKAFWKDALFCAVFGV